MTSVSENVSRATEDESSAQASVTATKSTNGTVMYESNKSLS